ncbi:MAG TPA: HlyD family efflux transporter periplasmic adaptor subunit [Anaerolineae bacterium]|nr:HlyD family efflux transporter periplasmic adaptor subunit [Anaerolineae bacterium]
MRKHRKHFIYVLLAGALIGAVGTGYSLLRAKDTDVDSATSIAAAQESPSSVSASGQIVPASWAQLSFLVGGQVETLVEEGQPVEAGHVLAQLDDAELQHALHEARAAQALAEADLARLKAGARGEDIAAAEAALRAAQAEVTAASAERDRLTKGMQTASIAAAEAALSKAQSDLKLAQDAYDRVPVYGTLEEQLRAQLNAARQARDAAQARLNQLLAGAGDELKAAGARVTLAVAQRDAAQAALDRARAGATSEEVAAAEARVEMARATVERAQALLDRATLRAPFAGTVARRLTRIGESIAPGQPVLVLGDLSRWQIETDDLSEEDVARVQVGQKIAITFDALPGLMLPGHVIRIAPMATPGQGGTNYTVVVAVEETDARLRWGMTAYPVFEE